MNIWFDFPLSEGRFVDDFENMLVKILLNKGKVLSGGIAALGFDENGLPRGEMFILEAEIYDIDYITELIRIVKEMELPTGTEMYVGEERVV